MSGALLPPGEASHSGVCIGGRAVPSFYLIGHQKCATTSYARVLLDAGLEVGGRGVWCPGGQPGHTWCNKELHIFDGLFCGEHAASGVALSCVGVSGDDEEAHSRFASQASTRACNEASGNVTLADFTPSYARLVGLPRLMTELHGSMSAALALVVMVREPLARMRSGYHDDPSLGGAFNFSAYAEAVAAALPRDYAGVRANASALSTRVDLDHWYRSMYGLTLSPWLSHFRPEQLLLLPTAWALGNVRASVQLIGARFPAVHIDAESVGEVPPALNAASAAHRTPDDPPAETIARLRDVYFAPDLELLASTIAALPRGFARGLAIGGLEAEELESGDEAHRAHTIAAHLRASW